ncbi:MAG TPA: hypothetical protein VII06_23695 [Chloroflexota bacterium]
MVADLPEVAAEWGTIPWGEAATDEQLAWSMDWGDEMAALEALGRDIAAGLLTAEQERRYRPLVQKIRDALSIIDDLRRRRPSVGLDRDQTAG